MISVIIFQSFMCLIDALVIIYNYAHKKVDSSSGLILYNNFCKIEIFFYTKSFFLFFFSCCCMYLTHIFILLDNLSFSLLIFMLFFWGFNYSFFFQLTFSLSLTLICTLKLVKLYLIYINLCYSIIIVQFHVPHSGI